MTFTVTKHTGNLRGEVLVERTGLSWDDAAKAALELGAIPGTGEANACAFETMRAGVFVSVDSE